MHHCDHCVFSVTSVCVCLFFQVLFHLLDCVRKSSTTADKEKIESGGGNILIHHSRDTAEKQWAETWVLTLAGVARIFNTRRYLLQQLGGWGLRVIVRAGIDIACMGVMRVQTQYIMTRNKTYWDSV